MANIYNSIKETLNTEIDVRKGIAGLITVAYVGMNVLLPGSAMAMSQSKKTELAHRAYAGIVTKIDPNLQKANMKRAITKYIDELADLAGNRDKEVTPQERIDAIRLLLGIEPRIADEYFGDNDGQAEPEEYSSLNSDPRVRVLHEIIDEHRIR